MAVIMMFWGVNKWRDKFIPGIKSEHLTKNAIHWEHR
ncbi:hypothetical protein DFO53_2203 [Enterobacter sp. AG5470]|nr:hypothetical protein DFO53_2203 [Enterobacter sp. AG5470]